MVETGRRRGIVGSWRLPASVKLAYDHRSPSTGKLRTRGRVRRDDARACQEEQGGLVGGWHVVIPAATGFVVRAASRPWPSTRSLGVESVRSGR
jgi:hypothetical protein